MWPIGNQFRGSGWNWFIIIITITTKEEKCKTLLCCLLRHYAELQNVSVPHPNEQQEISNVRETSNGTETDVGSELQLTSFNVTHPGLAAVKVVCSERERERERERMNE